LGYDHADPDEEKVMFALQEKIVKEWSLAATDAI
jgi:probable rRNA maturation factor